MMDNSPQRTTVHSQVVSAPPEAVYDLVADVTRWPTIFAPSLHVLPLQFAEQAERFQLWALVNGQVKTWTSRRTRDSHQLRISFAQEHTQPPFASMSGEWAFRSLAALGRVAELGHPIDDVVFSFEDTVRLDGTAEDAYWFVYRSDEWPQRLSHVSRVLLHEQAPGVQDMEMDTVTADGSTHTTRSIRLCFTAERIVYKQLVPPALLFGHSGGWSFADGSDGAVATARHTVAINPAAIPEILGTNKTLADAREFLRTALGANSRATLEHAGAYAQSRA